MRPSKWARVGTRCWSATGQVRRRYVSQLPQKLDYDLKIVAEHPSPFDPLLDVIREERGGNISIAADEFEGRAGGKDKFELHLNNLIQKSFGKSFVATKITVTFPEISSVEFCSVEIKPANTPTYLQVAKQGGPALECFYLRSGNSSQELSPS